MKKPNPKQFHTNGEMHSAMRKYAASKAKKELKASVLFDDGPEEFEVIFGRARKTVEYKTPDGETYGQDIDTRNYINPFLEGPDEMSLNELKAAFEKWIKPADSDVKILYIRWTYV